MSGAKRGRKPKPEEEKVVRRMISFPPDVMALLEKVPNKSAYIAELVRKDARIKPD